MHLVQFGWGLGSELVVRPFLHDFRNPNYLTLHESKYFGARATLKEVLCQPIKLDVGVQPILRYICLIKRVMDQYIPELDLVA